MALDKLNNLGQYPLEGIEEFIAECIAHDVHEINLTGTNTDPSLYQHHEKLAIYLQMAIPNLRLGLRTNGVALERIKRIAPFYEKASISVPSFDPEIYVKCMGQGEPPDIRTLKGLFEDIKVNLVLSPFIPENDLWKTLNMLADLGIRRVNLREPYGQDHVGNPLGKRLTQTGTVLGMPEYDCDTTKFIYWDVHYVEVESVNLYAQGRISVDYPITRGHDTEGTVLDQSHFTTGRHVQQWVK